MDNQSNSIWKNPAFIAGLSATIGGALGTFIGFGIGYRKALADSSYDEEDYPIVSVAESDLSPETLQMLEERRKNGTRESVIKGARPTRIITDEPAEEPKAQIIHPFVEDHDDDEEPTLVSRTVFAAGDDWDMEAELAQRDPDKPYPIHQDEFYEGDTDNRQLAFVYYEMDNVLADQEEVPVHLPENRVGPFLWGHGSTDPNKFFVRNEVLKEEYELIREPDKYYQVEVKGLELEEVAETELKHSAQAVTKMRPIQ